MLGLEFLSVQLHGDWVGKSSVDWSNTLTISVVLTHPKTNSMLSQVGEIRLNFTVTFFALQGRLFSKGFVEGCGRSAQKHCLSFDKGTVHNLYIYIYVYIYIYKHTVQCNCVYSLYSDIFLK